MREIYLRDLMDVLEHATVRELRGLAIFASAYIRPPEKEARHETV